MSRRVGSGVIFTPLTADVVRQQGEIRGNLVQTASMEGASYGILLWAGNTPYSHPTLFRNLLYRPPASAEMLVTLNGDRLVLKDAESGHIRKDGRPVQLSGQVSVDTILAVQSHLDEIETCENKAGCSRPHRALTIRTCVVYIPCMGDLEQTVCLDCFDKIRKTQRAHRVTFDGSRLPLHAGVSLYA